MDAKDAANVRRDLAVLGRQIVELAKAVEQVGLGLRETSQGQPDNGANLGAAGAAKARQVINTTPTR